jgi:hypothetical protein
MDNNATTRVADEVVAAMMPYLTEKYGNPSSMHNFGGQVGRSVARAREQVAALLGCEPDEIIFTSCGTESDNTAIKGTLDVLCRPAQGRHHPRRTPGRPDDLPRSGTPRLQCHRSRRRQAGRLDIDELGFPRR